MIYDFGPYTVSSEERVLFLDGAPVAIAPKAVDVLLALLARTGCIVSKADLIESVWPSDAVGEASLTQHVYLLRRLFARRGDRVRIENVRKRGYRLLVAQPPAVSVAAKRNPRFSWRVACIAVLAFCALLVAIAVKQTADRRRDRLLSARVLTVYMLGRADLESGEERRLRSAARRFSWTIAQAPQNPLGYAALSETDASLSYYATDAAKAIALQAAATTLAQTATGLDPYSAEACASAGVIAMSIQHDDGRAEAALKRALELEPHQLDALLWEAILFQREGRLSASHRAFMLALAVAPNVAGTTASLAWNDFLMHDYAGAISFSRQLLQAREFPSLARVTLANAYLETRDPAAARLIGELKSDPATRIQGETLAARLDALQGRTVRAAAALARLDDSLDPRRAGDWDAAAIAAAYAAVGDRDHAYVWLARVHLWERRETAFDPRFAVLSHDSRFTVWLDE
jgi:tetratricopeptide (TPR) repeat protein